MSRCTPPSGATRGLILAGLITMSFSTIAAPQSPETLGDRLHDVETTALAQSGTGRGALIGAGIGAAVGIGTGVLVVEIADALDDADGLSTGEKVGGIALFAAIGAGAGALLGAVIGNATSGWETVYERPNGTAVQLTPLVTPAAENRLGLGVSLRF